ncbi:MAG: 16S rRNA (guanine(527)-N(7))-methyltransferase RsmG [Bacteroidales bacterium]|nr:16S rRNA (guanine(527)-N(7))-methyltransferase RsmG [Bacteroidales bacterium]
MDIILKYFPDLSDSQKKHFEALYDIYFEWNNKINLISRKDFDQLYTRHILHSLSIAKVVSFKAGTEIMDVGTGGGFPGIPLAIMFPQSDFYLIDSIGKKIKAVNGVKDDLGLENVFAEQKRAEQVDHSFDFIVSRAVTRLPEFMAWVNNKVRKKGFNDIANGVLYIKGGDVESELVGIKKKHKIYNIPDFFEEDFFETKKVVHIY